MYTKQKMDMAVPYGTHKVIDVGHRIIGSHRLGTSTGKHETLDQSCVNDGSTSETLG